MNFSRFYRWFSQAPNFLMTFSPKVQISKFCSCKSMNWVQASMLKGFLWGLGTCHTFHNRVTKFSVFACPQLYQQIAHWWWLGRTGARLPNLGTPIQKITLALRQCYWRKCHCHAHQCFRWPQLLLALMGSINDWIIHKCGPGNQKKWESNDSQSLHRNSGSHWFVTKSFQIFSPVLSPSELEIDCVMTAKFPVVDIGAAPD